MKSNLVMILAATAFSAALVIAGSSTGTFVPPEPGTNAAIQQTQQQKEVKGKVTSVNLDQRTMQIEGTSEAIVVTDGTRYARGLSFQGLKAGMELKIVAVAQGDGRLEAIEVSPVAGS
ncbi:MAG: hypothetical protein IPP47_31030 [Bryobacterales bacterium]|nr:hypothetical protein [Bryobacterales bacterium]